MSEDWAAVAKAINERMKELGWQQQELAARSHVSSAIVREIQRNTVNRKRSPRTLESLSVALGWHPRHLEAVLRGERPPARKELTEQDLSGRLDALEHRLDGITEQLATVIRLLKASRPSEDR
ncbi:helix-turn-helix domain-containing protein [Amycolatopsis thermophila]|uniref:Transcriptional regulator with XRE-family HTH domain n=1 Tax=Amycolatopsis thermophila TaxID=206084 RepID=A0ABU0EV95_9PSEU|nr:XRE family transcriptional regulator [Amycolatopsis thermophila]MDQ0379059.1 transcriptional regulator with XRE-family HTH domain [Amycolatopsis thermophila]